MATMETTPAWIALFLGLYIITAVYAELRNPGTWGRMVEELDNSPALRLISGIVAFTMGAAIYLVTPWQPGDWLSVVVTVIGGLAVAKGVILIASANAAMAFYKKILGGSTTVITMIDGVLGVALILVALDRLGVY